MTDNAWIDIAAEGISKGIPIWKNLEIPDDIAEDLDARFWQNTFQDENTDTQGRRAVFAMSRNKARREAIKNG